MTSQQFACNICPHNCEIKRDEVGKCQVRGVLNNRVWNKYYGQCSHVSVETIEKRPFFHFLPGSKFLSVGFYGCSLACKFCQNFSISQNKPKKTKVWLPDEMISFAQFKQMAGIAFTYNEPTVQYEFLRNVGEQSVRMESNLRLCIKTNGFINAPIARDLATHFDAFNIDIKGNEQDYKEVCGGSLSAVKEAIETLVSTKVHVEISYLVLPSRLRDIKFHTEIRDWLGEMNTYVPVHILYFYPFFNMTESYDASELIPILNLFKEKLEYVYVSNCYEKDVIEYRNTICQSCSHIFIDRIDSVPKTPLSGRCKCGHIIKGVFAKNP